MLQGSVDVFISTFNRSTDDYVAALPTSKEHSIWSIRDVNSLNQGSLEKQLLVLTQDRSYCVDCYYLIGLQTSDGSAHYNVMVQSLMAERNDTFHLLRLGMAKHVYLNQSI